MEANLSPTCPTLQTTSGLHGTCIYARCLVGKSNQHDNNPEVLLRLLEHSSKKSHKGPMSYLHAALQFKGTGFLAKRARTPRQKLWVVVIRDIDQITLCTLIQEPPAPAGRF